MGPYGAYDNEWARYTSDDYLMWKYQLLIRGVDLKEFDFNSGIAFSTEEGER